MRGYTLFELLTVVALLGLLSALTAAGLSPLRARFRQRQATDAIAQLLVRARQRALETGRCHHVEILRDEAPVPVGKPGNVLRVSRRRDADCESPVDPLSLVEVERLTLPERLMVHQALPGEGVYRPNGRLRGGSPLHFKIGAVDSPSFVVAAPQGPVCTFRGVVEGCP